MFYNGIYTVKSIFKNSKLKPQIKLKIWPAIGMQINETFKM